MNKLAGSKVAVKGWHCRKVVSNASTNHTTQAMPITRDLLLNAWVSKIRRYSRRSEIFTDVIVMEYVSTVHVRNCG